MARALTDKEREILEKHRLWCAGCGDGIQADFKNANLCGADLRGANLREAKLCNAHMAGANLSGADLTKADMNNVILYKADLSETFLREANLYGAYGEILSIGPIGEEKIIFYAVSTPKGIFILYNDFYGDIEKWKKRFLEPDINLRDETEPEALASALVCITSIAAIYAWGHEK
jgi:hypothetical protein